MNSPRLGAAETANAEKGCDRWVEALTERFGPDGQRMSASGQKPPVRVLGRPHWR